MPKGKSPTSRKLHKILFARVEGGEKFVCYECESRAIYLLRTQQALFWCHFYCTEHARECATQINRNLYWMERLNGQSAGKLVDWKEFEE